MPESLGGIKFVLNTQLREYEDFRTQALELAETLSPEWTDFYPHDPGVVLVELFAGMAATQSFYIDRALNESHWSSAQIRRSLVNQAALIGYNPSPAVSATVDVSVTVSGNGTIPAGFKIGTQATKDLKQYTFELVSEQTVSGGAGTYTFTFTEGESITEALGTSDGSAGQSFQVSRYPVAYNSDGTSSIKVEVDEGAGFVQWTEVDNFIDSSSSDLHFQIVVDDIGRVVIKFGGSGNGKAPNNGASVKATVRIGGGASTNNIGAGKINKILSTAGIVTSVTNPAKPSGGSDKETVAEIKENAPAVWATQDRAVTHKDYESLARSVAGVHKAKASWYKGSPTKEAVYIAVEGDNPVPSGNWNVAKQSGTGMLGTVGSALVSKACASVKIHMFAIKPVTVNTSLQVHIFPTYYQGNVKNLVKAAIENLIRGSNSNEIPSLIPLSAVMDVVEDITGVDYVDVLEFRRVPYIEPVTVGISNTTLSDVTMVGNTESEIWTIQFVNATDYLVYGTVSGLQDNTGTVGSAYTTDNGELTFTLTAGSIINKSGDEYKIVTGKTVGNVEIQDTEIPVVAADLADNIEIIGGIV